MKSSVLATLRHPVIILLLPLASYLFSYSYLAVYHGDSWLFAKIIHEGGTLTLLQTIFYASHFLGHIPVYTVLAFYFVGIWHLLYADPAFEGAKNTSAHTQWRYAFIMLAYLAGSLFLSVAVFGSEETRDFILQRQQGVGIYRAGGSWLLHFPSTVLNFFFIPLYLVIIGWWFVMPIRGTQRGWLLAASALIGTAVCSVVLFVPGHDYISLWGDPRYMAHSVREMATFSMTYYPLPLFFFLKEYYSQAKALRKKEMARRWRWEFYLLAGCAVVFLGVFGYQVIVSLQAGIGETAQKPAFAQGGHLTVSYLLASHYFEHVLDTGYFLLLCLLLDGYMRRRKCGLTAADGNETGSASWKGLDSNVNGR